MVIAHALTAKIMTFARGHVGVVASVAGIPIHWYTCQAPHRYTGTRVQKYTNTQLHRYNHKQTMGKPALKWFIQR